MSTIGDGCPRCSVGLVEVAEVEVVEDHSRWPPNRWHLTPGPIICGAPGASWWTVCAELKLRAERKAGEILRAMPKAVNRHSPSADTMSALGIGHKQSSRWQQVAAVPEPEFERKAGEMLRAMPLRILQSAGNPSHNESHNPAHVEQGHVIWPNAKVLFSGLNVTSRILQKRIKSHS